MQLNRKELLTACRAAHELLCRPVRQKCEASFYDFFVEAWRTINPSTVYQDNWHVKVFCDEIQAATVKVIRKDKKQFDIIINTPPKSLKSAIFSVALPAWAWIIGPHLKFITCSYSPELGDRDCSDSRRLIQSDWFQSLWGHKFKLINDAATFLENDHGGQRRTTSPRSSKTGHKADVIIVDDPNAADDRYSKADREMVIRWWNETMSSRLDNPDTGLKIVIQQRIDDFDLTGHLLKEQPELYGFMSIPADLSEGAKPHPPTLEKFYTDGLMFPARLNREVLRTIKMQIRTAYSGQYNQRPIVTGGRFFKESWFRWFTKEQLPAIESVIISVDGSLTDTDTSCNASIQVWGFKRPNFFLLYDYTHRMTALATEAAIHRILKIYPGAMLVIERAANGYFLIEKLKRVYSCYEFNPKLFGGKEVRAEMVAPLWEVGNVFVADSIHNKTVYMDEIISFPNSPFKDRVDAMSQALLYFTRCYGMSIQAAGRLPGQV